MTRSYQNWFIYLCTYRNLVFCCRHFGYKSRRGHMFRRIPPYPPFIRVLNGSEFGGRVYTVSHGPSYRGIQVYRFVCIYLCAAMGFGGALLINKNLLWFWCIENNTALLCRDKKIGNSFSTKNDVTLWINIRMSLTKRKIGQDFKCRWLHF